MSFIFPIHCAFVALPLENEAKHAFQQLQERLRPYEKLFRFQNLETPHLTLYYWNSLMQIEYDDVLEKLTQIAEKTQPFSISITEASTFDDCVLYLDVARSQDLSALKKQCPWPNVRPFIPHITVARMRNPNAFKVQKKQIMKALKGCSFEASFDRMRLYAETDGVRQTAIHDFQFS